MCACSFAFCPEFTDRVTFLRSTTYLGAQIYHISMDSDALGGVCEHYLEEILRLLAAKHVLKLSNTTKLKFILLVIPTCTFDFHIPSRRLVYIHSLNPNEDHVVQHRLLRKCKHSFQ